MSDEVKNPAASPQEQPFNPFLGLDIGERWGRELGSIDARLNQLESDNREIKGEIKALDAKITAKIDTVDARLDRMEGRLDRLDERTRNLSMVTWGGIVVLLIAIIAQKLL